GGGGGQGAGHFFSAGAGAGGDILGKRARRKAGPRRGGGRHREALDEDCAVFEPPAEDVLALHEALEELERQDPLKAQIVSLRYFTGLTLEEMAEGLGLSQRTVRRPSRAITAQL